MQNETGRREKPSELYSIRSLNGNWSSYSKGKKRSSVAAATPAEAEAATATATTAGCSSKNNTNNFRMSLEATKTTVTTELSEKKEKNTVRTHKCEYCYCVSYICENLQSEFEEFCRTVYRRFKWYFLKLIYFFVFLWFMALGVHCTTLKKKKNNYPVLLHCCFSRRIDF